VINVNYYSRHNVFTPIELAEQIVSEMPDRPEILDGGNKQHTVRPLTKSRCPRSTLSIRRKSTIKFCTTSYPTVLVPERG
jgi:hypothetical protein